MNHPDIQSNLLSIWKFINLLNDSKADLVRILCAGKNIEDSLGFRFVKREVSQMEKIPWLIEKM